MEPIFPGKLGFDEWAELASSDPEAFEQLRLDTINRLIDEAPSGAQRQRLRGLQWHIDTVRSQAKTPLGACIRMYNMMWDKVLGEHGMLCHIQRTLPEVAASQTLADAEAHRPLRAEIIPFPAAPREKS